MSSFSIVHRGVKSAPVSFGLSVLEEALAYRNASVQYSNNAENASYNLLVGRFDDSVIAHTLQRAGIESKAEAEAVLINRCNNGLIIAAGSDDCGVMYALCELADKIRCDGLEALDSLKRELEYPAIKIRTAGRFIMSTRDDEWYFSKNFWDYYTARLAKNRINRFQLITGFDTAYFSPPYAFLVRTPGFEDTIADFLDSDPEQRRAECLSMLRFIGELCHSRGIKLCLGIWQHKPWTDNQRSLVKNIPSDECFAEYCVKGLDVLLHECPEIDALSFRVNMESGMRVEKSIQTDTDESFWLDIINTVKNCGRNVTLELRAKGLTDSMIDYALSSGVDMNVPTKAWCEHQGLPYQMLQMREEELLKRDNLNSSRRYSYDDMLRKSRGYDLQYRLWNYGSTNIFLWGNPYHSASFVKSCIDLEAIGYEFTAPLSLKGGHAIIPDKAWPIHVHPDMINYEWEDERYWMWYLSYGRMGYNPNASCDIWQREFRFRFGKDIAGDMEQAYLNASRILPLVTTAHFPAHPSLHYWPELFAGASLFPQNNYEPKYTKEGGYIGIDVTYAKAKASDEALFCSIDNYVEGELSGKIPRCYSPLMVRDWYHELAQNTRDAIEGLNKIPNNASLPEVKSSCVDFEMLAEIADFHSHMTATAYHLCHFEKAGDKARLLPAWQSMKAAHKCYSQLSVLGEKYYAPNLQFNAGTATRRCGNWSDWLKNQVSPDLADLEKILLENGIKPTTLIYTDKYESLLPAGASAGIFGDNVPKDCYAGKDLQIKLYHGRQAGISVNTKPVLHYRHINLREGEFLSLQMQRNGESFTATIPGSYLSGEFDLYVYFSIQDIAGNMWLHPGVNHPAEHNPAYIVRVVS